MAPVAPMTSTSGMYSSFVDVDVEVLTELSKSGLRSANARAFKDGLFGVDVDAVFSRNRSSR